MGSGESKPVAVPSGCPIDHSKINTQPPSAEGGCPVNHSKSGNDDKKQEGCPVKHSGGQQYNVYAQPIDPTNQMPFNPNQLPAEGQNTQLSTDRVKSYIPKGGASDETWTYPSPQMFYNALVRKGKAKDVDEKELDTVVAVHNNMNEKAWNLVMNWEKTMHPEEFNQGEGPKLSRFVGRPDDISPLAWVKSTFFGYPKPFDRHDWVIDRNGKEVRYVIDFYFDEEKSKLDEKPDLHDIKSIKSISMDARPAVDSIESMIDRIKHQALQIVPTNPTPKENETLVKRDDKTNKNQNQSENEPTTFESLNAEQLKDYSYQIGSSCTNCFEKVNTCESENECQKASVSLSYCMAAIVCKKEAEQYNENLTSFEHLEGMTNCLDRFETAALKLRKAKADKQ